MNFTEWFQNADMPTKDANGQWYDLEDGLAYESSNKSYSPFEFLTGSEKQIKWASDIIKKLNLSEAELKICNSRKSSKFWISVKDKSKAEIIDALSYEKSLKKAKATLKKDLAKKIAEIKTQDWSTLTQEQKNELYALIKQEKEI